MSRPLIKSEVADRSSCSWSTEDQKFKVVFNYLPTGLRIDLRNGTRGLTDIDSIAIGVKNPHTRIHDVVLAPWQDEAFLHLILKDFASSRTEHCIRRIRFPANRRELIPGDHSAIVHTSYEEAWLQHMVFSDRSKKFLLPFTNDRRAAVLLSTQFSNHPVYTFAEDASITSCGFMKGEEWWMGARVLIAGTRRLVVQASGRQRYLLPSSWPSDGRVRVLADGAIEASKEAYGDQWRRVGTF